MASPGFVHLHVHTAYSLLEGALPVGRLLDLAAADGQPALGIADTSDLFGALEFSEKAAKKGIQPIVGVQMQVDFATGDEAPDERHADSGRIVLIALNESGFLQMSRLVSRAYLESEPGHVAVAEEWLEAADLTGMVCLTGGPEGAIDTLIGDGRQPHAEQRLNVLMRLFGDRLYVELQRHGLAREARVEPVLIDLAYDRGLPLVATNEPFFPTIDDYEAHDALLAIAAGSVLAQTERRKLSDQHYFKSRDEMMALFADLPEALDNTVEIARRVAFRPLTRGPILPSFAPEAAGDPERAVALEASELARQAREGLKVRIDAFGTAPDFSVGDYEARLERELEIIENMKYPGYFLIVADFIKWAKDHDIPVGPGRGSGAGSLVAYALTITDIDPLRYNLLFERFLNPDRISMPDFDIDFCQDGREDVIRYVQGKYGHDQVAQIITFGSLQARAALRDVGRVLQMPYGQVDRICKLVPANPANPVTIAKALDDVPQLRALRDDDETVGQLIDISQHIEGLYRHASTHAAGIVIGDRPLQDLVPLYRDPRSDMPVTQYSLKWVEPAGLVKFDFLGLKTLTVIKHAIAMANRTGAGLTPARIPIDDDATYAMLRKGGTVGIFQIESAGMRRALLDMQPDRFEDIIALVALFRPGPMENIPSFCARKHGKEKFSVLHPKMEPILAETYGIIVYQEQVMQIAQVLAGYSLGEADVLRRAMGKKDRAEMNKQQTRFVEGCARENISENLANQIFDLLAKFADYGFNKSHAAAYALVSIQTAYLKTHFPREFLAASMTLDMGNTDKLAEFKRDANRLGIEVKAPDINRSADVFDVRDGDILYALCAVKGVGRQVAEHIVAVRGDRPFTTLSDFAKRVDPRIIGRRTLESLVAAGAFDSLVDYREQAFEAIEAMVGTSQRISQDKAAGMTDMFGEMEVAEVPLNGRAQKWKPSERLEREFAAIGFHLSGHPLDEYLDLLSEKNVHLWSGFAEAVKRGATAGKLAGLLASRQDRRTRKGAPMSILTLSDPTGSYECLVFSEQLATSSDVLVAGNLLILDVGAEEQAEGIRVRLLKAEALDHVALAAERHLTIHAESEDCLGPISRLLRTGGNGSVSFRVLGEDRATEFEIALEGRFKVTPELAGGVKSIPGVRDARLS
ncbi:MAG: DNA polymerase III subunit alpha [Hyphomicrobiaceae bacterium]|nr:DNA polymerase III subunit alpha [Hyphomicrobiaceae bacterium]